MGGGGGGVDIFWNSPMETTSRMLVSSVEVDHVCLIIVMLKMNYAIAFHGMRLKVKTKHEN